MKERKKEMEIKKKMEGKKKGKKREKKEKKHKFSILYIMFLNERFIEKCPISLQGGINRRLSIYSSVFLLITLFY